jgi:hypothetical protein
VEVKVSPRDLEHALEICGVTADELRQSDPTNYPELRFSDQQLSCLHGKHRVQAARSMYPPVR